MLETIFIIAIPTLILIGWSAIYYISVLSRRSRDVESDLNSLHTESCGFRFKDYRYGFYNLTKPLARYSIYNDFILVAFGNKHYLLNFKDIESVAFKRYSFSTGIEFIHKCSKLPKEFIIWPKTKGSISKELESRGLTIENET